jgi:hypothetical protein
MVLPAPSFRRDFKRLLLILAIAAFAPAARAEIVALQLESREPFASGRSFGRSGPYERLRGRFLYEVDPEHPENGRIADLRLAPRNAAGKVEFWADFFLLKPAHLPRGNRRLLYDVNNRGNKLALGAFNGQGGNDPVTPADAGNGFLLREGYSVLWCGWNGDVLEGGGRLRIGIPVATQDGKPITGRIYAEICVSSPARSQPFAWGNSMPYPAISPDGSTASLTRRPRRDAPAEPIPPGAWTFGRWEAGKLVPDPTHLHLEEGFRPGWLHDLVYEGTGPRVTGLGFAAVRDAVAFLRHAAADREGRPNPLAGAVERAYVFGISQSARFIQHFIYEDFNGDEAGRLVFDAALAHVGGPGRGLFNSRFAQTTRHGSQHEEHLYPSDSFPFTTVPEEDPLTGKRGDIFARARRSGRLPKVFFTETSSEYWCRAGSLLHTDVEGKRDVAIAPEARLYFFAGAQHGVASSPERGIHQNPVNILDHRPLLRALLVALDRWVSEGEEPPASRYPRIEDGTLIEPEAYRRAFPRLPKVALPPSAYAPLRLDHGPRWESAGIADHVPPLAGAPYRTLVPAADADGNDLGGIRLPDVAVPLATYTGWNLRDAAAGAEGMLARWAGSYLPFPRTREEREESGDPRPGILERYPSRERYLARVAAAVLELQSERFLLAEDALEILARAASLSLWPGE